LFSVLAWLAGRFAVAPALALTLLDGVVALSARAIARTATVDVLVPTQLLPEGNAVSNAAFSICFMVGPGIAGVAVATVGATTTLAGVALVFGLMALSLLTTTGLPRPSPARLGGAGRLRAAVEHVRKQPVLRTLFVLQTSAVVFFTMSIPVEIVLAKRSLHTGDGGYGGLVAAWGAGAIVGSVIYARWRRLSARTLIAGAAGALAGGFLVMAAAPGIGVAVVGAAIAGTGNGIESVAARTALQERVEDEWMGLMMGLYESILQAAPGAGIIIGGALAALAGPRVALGVAGGGALAITGLALTALGPGGGSIVGHHTARGAPASATDGAPAAEPR
jgi:hypothetical protein